MTLLSDIHSQLPTAKTIVMAKPNVVGIGVGEKITAGKRTGELAYVVLVRKKQDVPEYDRVPPTINGIKTDVVEVGEVIPHANLTRMRPAPGGVSVGNPNGRVVGTLGYFLRTEADRFLYVVSNNHVMGLANLAAFGDNIVQPGDGGVVPRDVIGLLFRFPFLSNGLTADCAIARINVGSIRTPSVIVADLDGFSAPMAIPGWFGSENQGAGIAAGDINGNGRLDLVVFHIDNPGGENHGYYRVGWNLDANGIVTGGWTNPIQIPGWFGSENQGGGIALADITGNGRLDLIVFHIDNPAGENHGYYRIGRDLDASGNVTAGWLGPFQIPGWFGSENQGGGVAVVDINNDARPEIVVYHIDNPSGENHGYYRIGWRLNVDGVVTGGWTGPTQIPGWFGAENQGGDLAIADINGDGRPEILATHIDNPSGENTMFYRFGTLQLDGSVPTWTGPRAAAGWMGSENQGAGAALSDFDGDGRPELIILSIDNPSGANRAYYRVSRSLFAANLRWAENLINTTGASIGERVWKSGRTSELTNSSITAVNVSTTVNYALSANPALGPLTCDDQIMITPVIGQPGDSGSIVVNSQGNVVGLYFAGSSSVGFANRIENVLEALRWGDPRPIPGWFGAENQGGGLAVFDVTGNGRPDLVVFHIDNPGGENHGYYRIGRDLDGNGTITGGWTAPVQIPGWFGAENQGGGIALVDINGNGRPDLVVFHIDNPGGENHGYYRIGWNVETSGVVSGTWTAPIQIPGWFGSENQGGSIAVFDVNGSGRPDLIVFHIDNPPGGNRGYYRIGWDIDMSGNVTGGWTAPIPIPGWFGSENQHGGIAVADLNGDGRPELIVFHIDNPSGENHGYYRIGWNLNPLGQVIGGWSSPTQIPGWFGSETQGAGIAVQDVTGNGRPDFIVFHIDNPSGENRGYHRIVYDIMPNGLPARWFVA